MAQRNFVVTVKETGDGKPWLLVEPHEKIGLDHGTHITMGLPEGADIHEAERVANLLNDCLASVQIRRF